MVDDVVIRVTADTIPFTKGMRAVAKETDAANRVIKRAGVSTEEFEKELKAAGVAVRGVDKGLDSLSSSSMSAGVATNKLTEAERELNAALRDEAEAIQRTNAIRELDERDRQRAAQQREESIQQQEREREELEAVANTTKVAAAAFLALAGSIGVVGKAAADFETALTGVAKTSGLAGGELKAFGENIQELSTTIPIAANDLLEIAQITAQLGVEGAANIERYTETIAKLASVTDLSTEEAAFGLARIIQNSATSQEEVAGLASAVSALGNTFATTETEIVNAAVRVSQATAQFDVTGDRVVAIATALTSAGVRAELAGSTIGRTFRAIDASIREGGASIENLSRITGIASDELKEAFSEDAAVVFQRFVEGLGAVKEEGGDVAAVLDAFNLKGEEVLSVLPTLAKSSEDMGRAFAVASGEIENATALEEEFARQTDTFNSRLSLLGNNINRAAVTIGQQFLPELEALASLISGLIDEFNDLDEETQRTIAIFIEISAILAGVVTVVGSLTLAVKGLRAATFALNPALLLVTAGVAGLAIGYNELTQEIDRAGDTQDEYNETLKRARVVTELLKTAEGERAEGLRAEKIATLEAARADVERTGALLETARAINKVEEAATRERFGDRPELLAALLGNSKKDLEDIEELLVAQKQRLEELNAEAGRVPPREDDGSGGRSSSIDDGGDVDSSFGDGGGDREADSVKRAQEASEQRILIAQQEQERLLAIREGATQSELDLLRRKQEIQRAFREAERTEDKELQATLLENARIKEEQLIADQEEFRAIQEEIDLAIREQQVAIKEEQDVEDFEREEAHLASLEALRSEFLERGFSNTAAFRKKLFSLQDKENKRELKLEQNKDKALLSGNLSFLSQLAGDNERAGRAAFAFQKAAAIAGAIVDQKAAIASGVAQAIKLPFPANLAAVAKTIVEVVTATAPAIAGIQGATIGAQQGGLIEGGVQGRDSVPALLEPGELVAPRRNFDEVVNAVAASRASGGGINGAADSGRESDQLPATEGGGNQQVVVDVTLEVDGEVLANIVTDNQNQNNALRIDRTS